MRTPSSRFGLSEIQRTRQLQLRQHLALQGRAQNRFELGDLFRTLQPFNVLDILGPISARLHAHEQIREAMRAR